MYINSIVSGQALTKLASNKGVQCVLSDLGNESKLLPILLLETGVMAGRCYHAKKRGGFYEFKETLLEGLLAAAVWMGGVKILNKAADMAFKAALNIDTKMDWKQVANAAKGRLNPEKFIKMTYSAKLIKLLVSVGASIFTVGFLLPKYKQKLTRESIERQKKEKAQKDAALGLSQQNKPAKNNTIQTGSNQIVIPRNITVKDLAKLANAPIGSSVRFEGTPEKHQGQVSFTGKAKSSGKDPAFTGAFDIISRVGYALENQAIPQLAVVDSGITGGRVINSRNKDEAIEFLFRDAASCMFYYFAVPFMTKRFANMFDAKLGVNTLLDPKALNPLTEEFNRRIVELAKVNKGVIGIDDIQRAILGTNNETVIKSIQSTLGASKGKALTTDQIKNIVSKALADTAGMPQSELIKELQTTLKAIGPRAANVAKMQADVVTSGNIRSLSNLLDDLVRNAKSGASTELTGAAKAMGELSTKVYGQVQSGGGLNQNTIKQVESIISKLQGSNIDDALMSKISQGLNAIKASSGAAGVITQEALEEVIKGGLVRDSRFLSKILSGINGAVVNPKAYVAGHEKAGLQKAIETYSKRVITELQKSGAIEPGKPVDVKKVQEAISNTLTKTKNKNILAKGLYLTVGIVIATIFLAWVIPKAQYLITKMRTGKDSFPGVAGLLDEEEKTTNKTQPSTSALASASHQSAPVAQQQKSYDTGSAAFDHFLKQKMYG